MTINGAIRERTRIPLNFLLLLFLVHLLFCSIIPLNDASPYQYILRSFAMDSTAKEQQQQLTSRLRTCEDIIRKRFGSYGKLLLSRQKKVGEIIETIRDRYEPLELDLEAKHERELKNLKAEHERELKTRTPTQVQDKQEQELKTLQDKQKQEQTIKVKAKPGAAQLLIPFFNTALEITRVITYIPTNKNYMKVHIKVDRFLWDIRNEIRKIAIQQESLDQPNIQKNRQEVLEIEKRMDVLQQLLQEREEDNKKQMDVLQQLQEELVEIYNEKASFISKTLLTIKSKMVALTILLVLGGLIYTTWQRQKSMKKKVKSGMANSKAQLRL